MDWSKHILRVKETEDFKQHTLQVENNIQDMVNFINIQDALLVTGDYGRWTFCREFHPSPGGVVSEPYWLEKLGWNSYQNPYQFDYDYLHEEIAELERELEDIFISKGDIRNMREFIDDLKHTGFQDEIDLISYFRDHSPACFPWEKRPTGNVLNKQLEVVFDAFSEICRRLEHNKEIGFNR